MSAPWRAAWIVGASSGIGAALARNLDGDVDNVVVSARSKDKLDGLAGEGRTIRALPLDVTDAQGISEAATAIAADYGEIDLVVMSAGAWTIVDAHDIDLPAMRRGIEVNYLGTLNVLHAVLPAMLERGRGHIAIIASVAGFRGLPRAMAYGPTKAALINLAETLRSELAPRGITVSLINPGFVDTPLTQDNPFPMPGLMSPEDAAVKIRAGLERRKYEIAFPFGLVTTLKLLRVLPNSFFFWAIRKFVLRG